MASTVIYTDFDVIQRACVMHQAAGTLSKIRTDGGDITTLAKVLAIRNVGITRERGEEVYSQNVGTDSDDINDPVLDGTEKDLI